MIRTNPECPDSDPHHQSAVADFRCREEPDDEEEEDDDKQDEDDDDAQDDGYSE